MVGVQKGFDVLRTLQKQGIEIIWKSKKVTLMKLPYSDTLEVQYLSRIFDNTSECYKFFWFQAIISKVLEGKDCITYEELVDEMIINEQI